jgi:hypothetical protein
MLDVHPPHEPMHGWRDFLLHILTITIGLLIAISLEGLVEWRHHRHLVHDAETSLHNEIKSNADNLPGIIGKLHAEQAELDHDQEVLTYIVKHGKEPENASASVSFTIATLDDVSWRTAQISGAIAFMDYATSQKYANLYAAQEELHAVEREATHDAMIGLAAMSTADKSNPNPFRAQAADTRQKIAVYQGQLKLIDAILNDLKVDYRDFLAANS